MTGRDAFVVLRLDDVRYGAAVRAEPIAFFERQADAEQEVQRLIRVDPDTNCQYRWQPAVAQPDGRYAFGIGLRDAADDDKPWRDRVLPVEGRQSCAVCGSDDWEWLFPLEPRQDHHYAFTFGYFLCSCSAHRAELDSDDGSRLALSFMDMSDGDEDDARVCAAAFLEQRIGAALTRREATRTGDC
jgi:hypothetical protein